MTEVIALEDDWNEAYDANIPRMDLVGRAANGSPAFLLVKADHEGGLMPPDVVRDLIAKATPEPAPTMTATTYTGRPADVMAAIYAASNPAARKEKPMTDAVLKADDAQDAADAVIGDDTPLPDADELNADAQPSADGSGVPTEAPGDPDDPSSPAWEAVDAARARQALQLTIALQRLVAQSADREAQEVAVGDSDADLSDVWTLEDVGCAIDAIINMLAPFAITEQAEADQLTADAMTKADGELIKAGRVLSSANETKIRGAAEALQSVLASLPAATEDAAPVAKAQETAMDATTEPEPAAEITKAKGDPMTPVYNENGKLVGMIDSADLVPIAPAAAADSDGDSDGGDAPAADAPDAPQDAPQVQPDANDGPAAAAPQTPAAPAADDTEVKKASDDTQQDLLKSVTDALKEALAPLEERIAKMEAQDMPNQMPMLNGATPGADIALRGQDADNGVADLRKAWQEETNPTRRQELQMQLAAHMVRHAPRTQ